MLCELCALVGRLRVDDSLPLLTSPATAGECEGCGRALRASVGDRVLRTMSHMARLGLTGQPLFSRRRAEAG
jgi:hypothetical protein